MYVHTHTDSERERHTHTHTQILKTHTHNHTHQYIHTNTGMNVHAFTEWLHAQDPVTFLPDEVLFFFFALVKQVKLLFFFCARW
jgi:hypothetical protein